MSLVTYLLTGPDSMISRFSVLIQHTVAVCIVGSLLTVASTAVAQTSFPQCRSASSDVDGDGWGWENNASCVVSGSRWHASSQSTPTLPACANRSSDSDGDGYGFENGRSCLVGSGGQSSPSGQSTSSVNNQPSWMPSCRSSSSDADGDGYGFENGRSCANRGQSSGASQSSSSSSSSSSSGNNQPSWMASCQSSSSDPDGDGFGWENNRTCANRGQQQSASSQSVSNNNTQSTGLPSCQLRNSDPDGDGFGWENNRTCTARAIPSEIKAQTANGAGSVTVNDITDVVLVTGQSNVLASGTDYNSSQDSPNSRVFAYTSGGWQVADLHQTWDRFQHPGNQSLTTPGRKPTNSFAFHFGKSLVARDSSRVVAFIVVPGPGKGIANWDRGTAQYGRITQKVTRALADIPHKYAVDAVLWHQGENDWLYEGTADANATGFTSENSYEYRNYYQIKLDALIANFRSESWGRTDTAFICGETRRAEGVNRRLMALNSDNDSRTGCVPATDLPKRSDDPYGSHFSAVGLRTLGKRYADKYFEIDNR